MKTIAVVGAGPAGSTLARLLAEKGHKVYLYQEGGRPRGYCAGGLGFYAIDRLCLIDKVACRTIAETTLETVRNLMVTLSNRGNLIDAIYVNSNDIYRNKLGVVIDREKFDYKLMQEAIKAGAYLLAERVEPRKLLWRYDYVVDARGFSSWEPCRDSEYTIQWWTKRRSKGPVMIIAFDKVLDTGYYWYFPAGKTGAKYGFGERLKSYPHKKRLLLDTGARIWLHRPWLDEEKKTYAAVLPLCGKVRLYEEGLFYVGTAAGFIDPATGAGIRYAIESAHALAEAIDGSRSKTVARLRYYFATSRIRAEIKLLKKIRKRLLEKDLEKLFSWAKKLDMSKVNNPYSLAKEIVRALL